VAIVLAMTVITLALGATLYGVHIRSATLPGLIVTLMLGTAVFTTLGIGIARLIPNPEAAPVVVNLTVFPLTFISSVWFPESGMPKALVDIANVFPIRPLADALERAFNPYTAGAGFHPQDLWTLAIWAVVGIFLMLRFLRKPLGEAG